ncbi:hypothetical protein Fmac_026522 [Flemingia macrophylla]|uniref:Uncharacterized protein n=1 Tax=Flemingia macrophylla TaxID=520843 RepID=A0ABD1LFP7_9FABA
MAKEQKTRGILSLAYLANASNLVLYLTRYMHMSPSKAANTVTNFMGTAFLLTLLGGFLSNAFLTTYHIYLISAVIELLVLIAASLNNFFKRNSNNVMVEEYVIENKGSESPTNTLNFLNKALKTTQSGHQ